jgi:hypothetical protein
MKTKLTEGFRANVELRKKISLELGTEIGGKKYLGEMIWKSCPQCKKQRWVRPDKYDTICIECSRKKRMIVVDGYEVLSKDDYFKRFGIKRTSSMIYYPCSKCGEYHWMARADLKRKSATGMCRKCFNEFMSITRGDARWNWKNFTRRKTGDGYIEIRVPRDDPFFSMANNGQLIREHRYIMAQHIGRPLGRWEIVHHVNCVKHDNRIENLRLVTLKNHHGEIICPHCGKPYTTQ